jgi:alkylation response protein AidB-like acyl-CoA dehydrogenase
MRCPVPEALTFVRSDEQVMLATTIREFIDATGDLDRVREMSLTESAIDRKLWDGLAEMGLIGLHIPEEYGGAGFGMPELAVVFQELGRMVAPVPLLSSVLASTAILKAGTDDQKREVLPSIASGDVIATLAAYESAHDGDPQTDLTALLPDGDGFTLSGVKRYVTDAPNAALIVTTAATDDGTVLVVVDADAEGVTVTPTRSLDATRPLGEVRFDDVKIDSSRVMSGGDVAARAALDVGAVALAQEQVGGAERCLEASVEYAKTRFQFGRAIGSFQAVKHRCADMLVAVEHAKSAAWHAARTLEDAEESRISVPLARSVCSDAYLLCAGDNIQIHGGIGFTWEHDAHLYFKRAKSTSLLLGSVALYRDRLADAVGF